MSRRPTQEVAVVTGGAGAIGSAIRAVLVEDGYLVAAWDRAGQEPSGAGCAPSVESVVCDVTDPAQIVAAVASTHRRFGPISLLVNAVGLGQYGEPFNEMDYRRWAEIVATNLVGAMNCVHAVLPDMIERQAGVVVNICSIWSTNVAEGRSAYIASKWGLLGATKAIATELIGKGVRCCAVSPGPVDTPMTAHIAPASTRRTWISPAEVAAAVRFAVSPAAAHLVGGEVQLFGQARPITNSTVNH